jgi:hypothetical protein
VANIGSRARGWDILYCNLFFNHFAQLLSSSPFDKDGLLGRQGKRSQEVAEYLGAKWPVQLTKVSLEREKFEQLIEDLKKRFSEVPS